MQGASEEDDGDPSLDFTSSSFDALKALHTDPSKLQLPYPKVQPCDNLDAYQSIVHGKKREAPIGHTKAPLDTSHRDNVDMAPPSDNVGRASSTGRSREVKVQDIPTVLTFMQKSEQDPFDVLRLCRCDGVSVRVWIRHCVGVRGVCEGVPVAFDRHMNLVLHDVVERYVPFRTTANGGVTESASKRKRAKRKKEQSEEKNIEEDISRTEQSSSLSRVTSLGSHVIPPGAITRHLNQLFIRGDNIIMINRLLPESPPQTK